MWRRSGRGFLWKRRATCKKVKLEIDEIMRETQSDFLIKIQGCLESNDIVINEGNITMYC